MFPLPSNSGYSGAPASGNSYSTISAFKSSNLGLINRLRVFPSFALSALCASTSTCQYPEKPNVVSPWNLVFSFSLIDSIGITIGEMFRNGFEIFTLTSSRSEIGLPTKSVASTIIEFAPVENGKISILNFT